MTTSSNPEDRNEFHLTIGGMMALTTEEMARVERTHARWRASPAATRLEQAVLMHERVITGKSTPRQRQVDAWLAYLMLTDAPWDEVLGPKAHEVRRYASPALMRQIANGIPCKLVRPDRRKRMTTTYFDEHGGRETVRGEVHH